MIPLNSILSTKNNNIDVIVYNIPKMVALGCAIILLIAFFIGFAKGFKRVGWTWLTCLLAFVGFVFFDGLLKKKGLAVALNPIKGLSRVTMTTFIIAFGCMAIALVLYGFCSAVFRPKTVWKKKDKEKYRKEQRSGKGDGNPRYLLWKNYAPPTFFERVLGGFICLINVAVILALILAFVLLLIHATSLSTLNIGLILKVKISQICLDYAKLYALDFVTLCIPFFLACYGYKRGCISSLRTIIVNAGTILIFLVSFWLPFSPLVGKTNLNFLGKLNERCYAIIGNLPPNLRMLLAKLLAGVVLLVVFAGVLILINYLLGKFENMIKETKAMRVTDSIVSCGMYFAIGVMLCVLLWAGLYALDVIKLFKISEVISDKAVLSNELWSFAKTFMDNVLEPFMRPVK